MLVSPQATNFRLKAELRTTTSRRFGPLKRRGIEKARPLAGGFSAWFERGFPVEVGKA